MFYLGLIMPICFIPGYTGASIPTQWAVLSILLPLGLWREGAFGPGHLAGLAALAWSAISFLWAPSTYDAANGLWLLMICAGCLWLGSTILDFRQLLRGLAIGLTISSAVAVGQHFGFNWVEVGPGNPPGLLYNSTVLGASAALVLIALVSRGMWLYIPGLLPAIYLTNSRGAYAILLGTALARIIPWPIVFSAGVLGFAYLTINPSPSDIQRLLLWGSAFREFNIFGHGIGSYNTYLLFVPSDFYINSRGIVHPEFAHNDYIQLWFELGIGAIAIYTLYAIALSQTTSQQWPTFFAFFLLGWFYFPLYCPLTAFIGCVFAGRIIGDWHINRTYRPPSRSTILPRHPHQRRRDARTGREAVPI